MKRVIYFIFLPFLFLLSCKEDPQSPETVNPDFVKRTVLIYAVNKSSLSYDFNDDLREMKSALKNIDLNKFQLLIYKTDSDTRCGLYSFKKAESDSEVNLELIKDYERNITSTAPERIKEVITESISLYPNSRYDLIFWGHGMSWKPYFSDHEIDKPQSYAYGGEYTGGINTQGGKETDWTEIDELAECLPDNFFDTVWFDCCYMSGIEVLYEFKNKCNSFVGYPSEVWSYGLAYDLILPYLLSDDHNIIEAAKSFYNYYNSSSDPVTVTVIDMTKIEKVAEITKEIFNYGILRPDENILLNYSRTPSSPFYDFRQFIIETAVLNNSPLEKEFYRALDDLTLYHAESKNDFNNRPWDYNNISGISTHFFKGDFSKNEEYYKTLSWYKRVHE